MNTKIFQIIFYVLRLSHAKILVSARIPLAQALIESARWTSALYQSTNNMFGMMHPQARSTTSLGPNAKGFATYRSPLDCIRDYFLYLEAFEVYNDGALDARIAAGKYATDPNYYKKVVAMEASLKNEYLNPAAMMAKTAVAAAVAVAGVSVAKKALS